MRKITDLIKNSEKLDKNKRYIFCPNHTSTLDIPLVTSIIPLPLLYMGKKELASIPLFGYFYRKNSIIVDRSKLRDSYAAFIKAAFRSKPMICCPFFAALIRTALLPI